MKFVSCNLCGTDDSRELYPSTLNQNGHIIGGSAFLCTSPDYGEHYRIVQCKRCGFVYANPHADPRDVLKAYENVVDPLYLQERVGREYTFREHLRTLQHITGEPNGRRLLDVGAYIGVFVEIAREMGWNAEGVEPSSWAVAYAHERGLPVAKGTLESGGFPDESFDVITLWDVIEHFDDPTKEIQRVFRLLKPGGIVVIHTIDIGSVTAQVMGGRWPFLMEMHIMFFTRVTLRTLLQHVGFTPISDHTQGRYLRLGYLAGRMTAAFGDVVGKPLEKLISFLNLVEAPVPVNTLDLFTMYAKKPGS